MPLELVEPISRLVTNSVSCTASFTQAAMLEAIEGPPRTLAVQWHPERQERDVIQKRLFRYFVRTCRDNR